MTDDKIIRIQGDRLCNYLGYPPGTKINLKVIQTIAESEVGDSISINGKTMDITMSMRGIALVLMGKICS